MNLEGALDLLARNPAAPLDVAELALCLARDEYPDLDVEAYLNELAAMAHEAHAVRQGKLESRVAALCRYLFHDMGFRGNVPHYYDPRNSYLNQVMDSRTGIPITLSILAMAIGARAGLEVAGIGLPGHFVAKASEGDSEVVFDPFHGGRVLTPEDCELLVEKVTGIAFEATSLALAPLPPGLIVRRLLTNLKSIYLQEGDYSRAVRTIERLRQLNPHDLSQRRDLGVAFLRGGQPGKALDHLSGYLSAYPDAEDAEKVQQLMDRAQIEVARWN